MSVNLAFVTVLKCAHFIAGALKQLPRRGSPIHMLSAFRALVLLLNLPKWRLPPPNLLSANSYLVQLFQQHPLLTTLFGDRALLALNIALVSCARQGL